MTSIDNLPADMLLKIIQTITIDKDKEIAKLKKKIECQSDKIFRFENAIENQDGGYFECEECDGIYYGDCCFDDSFKIDMPCCGVGDIYICGDCYGIIDEDEELQKKYVELSTFYSICNTNEDSFLQTKTYNTYEDIPTDMMKSDSIIKKIYYKNWLDLTYEEEDDLMIEEIINGVELN